MVHGKQIWIAFKSSFQKKRQLLSIFIWITEAVKTYKIICRQRLDQSSHPRALQRTTHLFAGTYKHSLNKLILDFNIMCSPCLNCSAPYVCVYSVGNYSYDLHGTLLWSIMRVALMQELYTALQNIKWHLVSLVLVAERTTFLTMFHLCSAFDDYISVDCYVWNLKCKSQAICPWESNALYKIYNSYSTLERERAA